MAKLDRLDGVGGRVVRRASAVGRKKCNPKRRAGYSPCHNPGFSCGRHLVDVGERA